MKGYHAEEIATLNDEELDNLIKILSEEKTDRQALKFLKKEKLVNAFEKAWKDLEKEGFEIWLSGDEYTDELDLPLNLNKIYFD